MRFRVFNRSRPRPMVAGVVEAVVAVGMSMAVSVFFVAMVVYPNAMHVPAV